MVRCERYLQIIRDERLVESAARVGALLLQRLEELCDEFAGSLSNARGKGLMCAFDAKTPEMRNSIFSECFKRNVLVLKCGTNSIRLRPLLTFGEEELAELMPVLKAAAAAAL